MTNSRYIHEPFNWTTDPDKARYHMRYMPANGGDPRFDSTMKSAIRGGLRDRLRTVLSGRPVLIKEVHACLAAEHIYDQFRTDIVILARHPLGVVSSWKRLGFPVRFKINILLEQDDLVEKYLSSFVEHMTDSKDYHFQAGAFWGASYFVLRQIAQSYPEWHWVTHEALCEDPHRQFRALVDALKLPVSDGAEQFIDDHNRRPAPDDGPYAIRRESSAEPDKWKRVLNSDESAAIMRGAEPFGVIETLYPGSAGLPPT